MTREQFDDFVRRVERRYEKKPLRLRLRIACYVALSYALFLAWILLAVSAGTALIIGGILADERDSAWLIGLGIAVVLGLGGWALRVFWVKLEPPEGIELSRKEAPELFAMLDELRAQIGSAPFHRVVVDGTCNAAVVQQPLLGVFGWQRNHLLLGLPLLDAMSREELRAVLGHEFSHLSAQHGRFGAWIYRLRTSWEKVFAALSQDRASFVRRTVTVFIEWFWPRFNAHAFVLSRANEYEADAGSARVAGVEHVASALLRSEYYGRMLDERSWPAIWLTANKEATPPGDVYWRLKEDLVRGGELVESGKWVEQAFRRTTTNADTHPSLIDRLRALGFVPADPARGVFPPAPLLPRQTATASLLGPLEQRLRDELGKKWKSVVELAWKDSHARAGVLQHRLESLDRAVPIPDADVDSLWDKAHVKMNLENDAAAEPYLRQVLQLSPSHAGANFCLGRHLLTVGDDEGVILIERAMDEDDSLIPTGCEMLMNYQRLHGREDKIRELARRLDGHEAAMRGAREESINVTARDTFIPHELSADVLAGLAVIGVEDRDIRSIHVMRKQLRHMPKKKLFVVVITPVPKWFGAEDRDRALVARMNRALQLPGRTLVVTPRGDWKGLSRKLSRMTGSQVYRKTTK